MCWHVIGPLGLHSKHTLPQFAFMSITQAGSSILQAQISVAARGPSTPPKYLASMLCIFISIFSGCRHIIEDKPPWWKSLLLLLLSPLYLLFVKTPKQGAATQIHLCMSPKVITRSCMAGIAGYCQALAGIQALLAKPVFGMTDVYTACRGFKCQHFLTSPRCRWQA